MKDTSEEFSLSAHINFKSGFGRCYSKTQPTKLTETSVRLIGYCFLKHGVSELICVYELVFLLIFFLTFTTVSVRFVNSALLNSETLPKMYVCALD